MIISKESYGECVAEAAILNALHWWELYGKAGYRADHGGIVDLEKNGGFAYFTIRSTEGFLMGHAGFMLIDSPFYGCVIALDAFYYIKPEYRGQMGMTQLLKFAATNLVENGIETVAVSHKTNKNISPLIERAGFVKSGEMFFFNKGN